MAFENWNKFVKDTIAGRQRKNAIEAKQDKGSEGRENTPRGLNDRKNEIVQDHPPTPKYKNIDFT